MPKNGQKKMKKWGQNFFGVSHMSKNNIGHVFSFKNFFFCVLLIVPNLPWKQGLESTQMKTILNEKTWPMLFFDICETPKKI